MRNAEWKAGRHSALPTPHSAIEGVRVGADVPAGLYQVRFRFEADRGSERAALDDITIDGSLAITTPPCRPIIDGQPPTAVADSASSLAAQPVVLSLLANDVAGTSPIDPATVDLVPGGTAVIERERDIRSESGVVIARAVVDALGNVSVTPTPEASGTIVFAYSVRDTAGRISNIAQVTVTVLEASTDLQVTLTGPTAAEAEERSMGRTDEHERWSAA